MSGTLQKNLSLLFIFLLSLTACSDSGSDGPAPVVGQLVSDIPGNLPTTVGTTFAPVSNIQANVSTTTGTTFAPVSNIPGNTETEPGYTFYDLDTQTIITDSASSDWDIAFGSTTILANSGNNGGIQVVDGAYADVTDAPTDGYADQTESGSWYSYNPATHVISAKEDKTIVVLTPDGNYAKVQITSYYHSETEVSRYFTFNFALKLDGSTQLYHEETLTYFDLESGAAVEASASWDIAFNGTTVLANSENGGGIQAVDGAYADVTTAPGSGYSAQTESGSWYSYNPATHIISPNEAKTLVVHTPEGNYARVQVLSYYKDNPELENASYTDLESRYYTFNYTLKLNGSTELYHTDTATYYDLDSGEPVEDPESSQWDIAFSGTTIEANSANGGGIQGLNIAFANTTEAPTEGYSADNSGWYTYTGNTAPLHAVLPLEDYTLVVQTPDGLYAKVRIISYYEGNPDTSSETFANTETRPESRYFTFEYAIQTDGSTFFEE